MMGEMMRLLAENGEIGACKITPAALAQVVELVHAGTINGAGKQIIEILFKAGGDPQQIIDEKDWLKPTIPSWKMGGSSH